MTTQLALWEPEPCHHGKAPAPGGWTDTDLAAFLHDPRRTAIPPDAGRPAGRPTWRGLRPVDTVNTPEEYL